MATEAGLGNRGSWGARPAWPVLSKKPLAFAGQSPILTHLFGHGLLAQLVERLNGIEEVSGSNPLGSTIQKIGQRQVPRFAR